MRSRNFKLLSLFFLLFIWAPHLNAQKLENAITLELEKDAAFQKTNLMSLVVVIKNASPNTITGKLSFITPKGFRNVGSQGVEIEMLPNETRYVPIKFLIGEETAAGPLQLSCKLTASSGELLAQQSIVHTVEVNKTLSITALENTLYRTSNNDFLSVRVKVSNKGNIQQKITLVCKFPDPANPNLFIEQNATLRVKKDSIFTFTYHPSKELAKQSNFTVRISGFRNPSKELFGSAIVEVHNIASVQQYQGTSFNHFVEETQNQITSSYRRFGSGNDFYQLHGSGGVNIPSGYLFLRGNIVLANSLEIPLITNTNLLFRQEGNEFTIGNINKLFEMTLAGRGVEYSHTFEKNQKIEVGFVDQNYNLIEKNNWLNNGYSFFARGTLHSNNNARNASADYLYRYDPFEQVKHNIVGTAINYNFNDLWKFYAKVNGALSFYGLNDFVKPSFAGESNHSGQIKNIDINGNYYFSSNYYPGNRRGSLQLQENISTTFKDNTLHANVMISNFAPRFYSFETQQESANTRIEIMNRFPRFRDFSFSLGYQYQGESSNSYNTLLGSSGSTTAQQLRAQRVVNQLSWTNNPSRQAATVGFETGIVKYPLQTDNRYQMKVNANYSFRNFNINSNYQSGSYYLSEYAFSTILGNSNYEKLAISLFYDSNLVKNKINLSSGVSYIKDIVYGKSPSAFINARYNANALSVFCNSSWYNYATRSLTTNTFTFEVGLTVNLQKTVLNPDRKGLIKAFVFYDTNNNNLFDDNEKYAADYMINIDKTILQTNKEGKAFYKKIPYGIYILKQLTQDGWYYEDDAFEVDSPVYNLTIPLHQSGKIEGKVSFVYNSTLAQGFDRRSSGISFTVLKDNKQVQKVYTNDEGKFISFLPTADYVITIDEKSLPVNTYCEVLSHEVTLKAGEIVILPEFIIKVKEKKIHSKKFSN